VEEEEGELGGGGERRLDLKMDENGLKNIYPVFTVTFFSRSKMKTGMTETKMSGTYSVSQKRINSDGNIL
jgi:hypothetical protein